MRCVWLLPTRPCHYKAKPPRGTYAALLGALAPAYGATAQRSYPFSLCVRKILGRVDKILGGDFLSSTAERWYTKFVELQPDTAKNTTMYTKSMESMGS